MDASTLTREEIDDKLFAAIESVTLLPPMTRDVNAALREGFSLDDIDIAEVVSVMESDLGIEIEDEALWKFRTFTQIVEHICTVMRIDL